MLQNLAPDGCKIIINSSITKGIEWGEDDDDDFMLDEDKEKKGEKGGKDQIGKFKGRCYHRLGKLAT